jgi:DNA-binding NtrC family response regulator
MVIERVSAYISGMELAHREVMNKPIRILFVDDDPEMRAIYAENFLPPDFQISTAPTGERALEMLQTAGSQFDVVITDNYMPGMSGRSLLKQINHIDPSIKLLMVTAFDDWNRTTSHSAAEMKLVEKPVKMADLKSMIEKWPAEAR